MEIYVYDRLVTKERAQELVGIFTLEKRIKEAQELHEKDSDALIRWTDGMTIYIFG